jgi:hypothetical protein
MEEKTFTTVLKNERKTKGVVLWDRNGNSEGILMPGRSRTIESWNPEAIYSPFSSVIWKENGEVETVPNPEYPSPKSRWMLTVLNKAGGELERRIIGGRERVLPKGLARTFALEPEDRYAIYERVEIVRVVERSDEENPEFPEYSRFRPVVRDKFFDRPESELVELEAELKRLSEIENG